MEKLGMAVGSSLLSDIAQQESGRHRSLLENSLRAGISSYPIGFAVNTYLDFGEFKVSREVKTHRQVKERIKKEEKVSEEEADLDAYWLLNSDIESTSYSILKKRLKK